MKPTLILVFFSMLLGAIIGGLIHYNFFTNKLDLTKVKEIEVCEPSIRSLEQELKICFYHNNNLLDLVGIDQVKIAAERDMWKDRSVKASIKIDKLEKENKNCQAKE